jgi:hypothetical protein
MPTFRTCSAGGSAEGWASRFPADPGALGRCQVALACRASAPPVVEASRQRAGASGKGAAETETQRFVAVCSQSGRRGGAPAPPSVRPAVMKRGMTSSDRTIFATLPVHLRGELPGCGVWAYGSRARGGATAESDPDVCVVADHLDRPMRDLIGRIAWETGFESGFVICTVKYTHDAFHRFPGRASPLVAAIQREGVPA